MRQTGRSGVVTWTGMTASSVWGADQRPPTSVGGHFIRRARLLLKRSLLAKRIYAPPGRTHAAVTGRLQESDGRSIDPGGIWKTFDMAGRGGVRGAGNFHPFLRHRSRRAKSDLRSCPTSLFLANSAGSLSHCPRPRAGGFFFGQSGVEPRTRGATCLNARHRKAKTGASGRAKALKRLLF